MKAMMKLLMLIAAAGGVVALLVLGGAAQPKPDPNPFPQQDNPERVTILCIDNTVDGKVIEAMWALVGQAIDQDFRLAGGTSRVVVAHLTRAEPVVLVGTPMELRRAYPDFDAFRKFLQEGQYVGSRVFAGVADAIDFSRTIPGNPAMTLLVFSDCDDNVGGDRDRLLRCLAEFGQRKDAAAGFYFVQKDFQFWDREVRARVKYAVVNPINSLGNKLPARE